MPLIKIYAGWGGGYAGFLGAAGRGAYGIPGGGMLPVGRLDAAAGSAFAAAVAGSGLSGGGRAV